MEHCHTSAERHCGQYSSSSILKSPHRHRGTGLRRLPLCSAHHRPQAVAACPSIVTGRILTRMGTKSRETIYGGSVRAAAEIVTQHDKNDVG
jgi:hypothetical protein